MGARTNVQRAKTASFFCDFDRHYQSTVTGSGISSLVSSEVVCTEHMRKHGGWCRPLLTRKRSKSRAPTAMDGRRGCARRRGFARACRPCREQEVKYALEQLSSVHATQLLAEAERVDKAQRQKVGADNGQLEQQTDEAEAIYDSAESRKPSQRASITSQTRKPCKPGSLLTAN